MTTARIFSIAFVTGFSGAMMPGPMLALVIGQTGAQGMRAVWAILAGHAALEVVTVVLLVAGLRQVLQRPKVRGVIGLIGGAALGFMGIDMIRSASRAALQMEVAAEHFPWLKLFLAGAAVCIANPYFVGWWATVGTGQLAHSAPRSAADYIAFYLGHELSDVVWYAIVGWIIVTGSAWLSPAVYMWLVLVCGIAIVALGLWFVWTGVAFTWLGAGTRRASPPAPDRATPRGTDAQPQESDTTDAAPSGAADLALRE